MSSDGRVVELVRGLTLDDKARLVTGMTSWRTWALPQIGLREMVFSDGPVGVRGTGETAGEVSDCLPSPSAIAACWDTPLAHEVGGWFAEQARTHGVDVVLAPVVNLHRTPLGGRHFECLSEDPLLSADLAAALITGMQERGVGACVKHFVGNEVETDRTQYLSVIDESTLREVYLAPFERAVTAGVWSVMASYNRTKAGGETSWMVAHHHLLVDILKNEWGFPGPVVSDWTAARETVPTAVGGLDLVMPGPGGPWSDGQLIAAVRAGLVPIEALDDKVARLLWLAHKVSALSGPDTSSSIKATPTDTTLPRQLAARAMVVLTNHNDSLPLKNPHEVSTIALIGPNALDTRLLGGGSASVNLAHPVSLLDGLTTAFPASSITVRQGVTSRMNPPEVEASLTRVPDLEQVGVLVEYLNRDGATVTSQIIDTWSGTLTDDLSPDIDCLHLATDVELSPGTHWLGIGTVGRHTIMIDHQLVSQSDVVVGGEVMIDSSFNVPPAKGTSVEVTQTRRVRVEAWIQCIQTQWGPRARAAICHRLPGPDEDQSILDAAQLAASVDLAIVVVGSTDETESEGWDRTDLRLPGRQDDLVNAVLDARPDAIIAVNAGAPVTMDWLDRAQTVVWTWFPGQDAGSGLADVLLGVTEPSGRLPWTLPDAQDHCPVPTGTPDQDGIITYAEGVHVGYRGWARSGFTPARPFGFGLGWTTWELAAPRILAHDADTVQIAVQATNVGPRPGSDVIQAYLHPPVDTPVDTTGDDACDRPVVWLAGHTRVEAAPGERVEAVITLARRAFEVWHPSDGDTAGEWVLPTGTYSLGLGHNVSDLPLSIDITWPARPHPITPKTPQNPSFPKPL